MLSKRLKRVLEYIQIDDKIVDVGCDHGYLAKEAILKGVSVVQLVDNKKMPLKKAVDNMSKLHTSQKIIYTLANGLSKIEDEIDVACICGMGGDLIVRIIEESFFTSTRLKRLILQPNTKVDHLRKYLSDSHFIILDETLVEEKEKYYHIIVARYDENSVPLNELEIKYGPILLKKMEPCFIHYLNYRLQYIEKMVNFNPNSCKMIQKMNEKKEIEEILKYEIK